MGDVIELESPELKAQRANLAFLEMCKREGVTPAQARAVLRWLLESPTFTQKVACESVGRKR